MGLLHFSSAKAALQFERFARHARAEDAREMKRKLWNELGIMHDSLVVLLEAGAAKDAIAEALAGLIDAVSNADHAANNEIDAAGEWFDPIDLSEARALLAKVQP